MELHEDMALDSDAQATLDKLNSRIKCLSCLLHFCMCLYCVLIVFMTIILVGAFNLVAGVGNAKKLSNSEI